MPFDVRLGRNVRIYIHRYRYLVCDPPGPWMHSDRHIYLGTEVAKGQWLSSSENLQGICISCCAVPCCAVLCLYQTEYCVEHIELMLRA